MLIDVEQFDRRRGVAALTRGDSLDLEEVPTRPNALVAVGVVIALLISGASVATAYLSGRAPDGWRDDGTLVLDEQTGARFVADGGVLHPAPTLTGALLAGARPAPVLVPHGLVEEAPLGAVLPGDDLPERPPALPPSPTGFTACFSDGGIDVHAGAPTTAPAAEQGLLLRVAGDGGLLLVSGRRAHPVDDPALAALGYSTAQVREVPPIWAALVPAGERLGLLALPPVDPARGVDGVGAGGEVVAAAGSGRRFVVTEGTVRPLANRTSERLAPAPVREVSEAVLASAPAGPPIGVLDAPEQAPEVPAGEAVVIPCVRSSDGLVTVAEAVAQAGTRGGNTREVDAAPAPVRVRWHFPPGQGALVGPLSLDEPGEPGGPGTGGILVVADGVGHGVVDLPALGALGYRREQTVLLPDPWLALLARGGDMASPSPRQ